MCSYANRMPRGKPARSWAVTGPAAGQVTSAVRRWVIPIAGPPTGDVVVPSAVQALALSRDLTVVWQNQLGGLTFEVGGTSERAFVKWAPAGTDLDLAAEAARMSWAGPFTPVPQVRELGADDEGAWLVTSPLPGRGAVSDRWRADPAIAVTAIGEGLRALHDALPVERCPFSWSIEERLDAARRHADAGEQRPADWHVTHHALTVQEALVTLAAPPPIERLVVCHGDACAPNTIVADDGRWSGHVDLGALGVADRWADLAIATWSTGWNYGPGWEEHLLEAYGVEADPWRIDYYRLLWDLT